MSSGEVELLSAWFCPFAQRAWIAAQEKGIEYKLVEVDPYAKPPELLAVNPRGLVPGLKHGDKCVYESMVVLEYIDEAFDGPDLLPKDPYQRAVARIWMDQVNRKIVPTFYRFLQRQDKGEQEAEKEQLLKALEEFVEAMSLEGPFFFGTHFTLVDITILPWLVRFDPLEHFRGFVLPDDAAFHRLQAYIGACTARPGVAVTLADKEKLRGTYRRYADNTATSGVAQAINKNTALP